MSQGLIKPRADVLPAETGVNPAGYALEQVKPRRSAQILRESIRRPLARRLLLDKAMTTYTNTKRPSEAWTIPLHIVIWTTITVGFIMALVILMLH